MIVISNKTNSTNKIRDYKQVEKLPMKIFFLGINERKNQISTQTKDAIEDFYLKKKKKTYIRTNTRQKIHLETKTEGQTNQMKYKKINRI